jgi:importin subunit alpha-1
MTAALSGKEVTNFFLTPKAFRVFERIWECGKIVIITQLIWLITHIAGDNEDGRNGILGSNIFDKILNALESDTVQANILKYGIWLIANISKNTPDITDISLFKRLLKILCVFLRCEELNIIYDCLWGVGNFSNTKQVYALRFLLDTGIVPIVMNINIKEHPGLAEIPLRIIGNLLTGDDYMVDQLISYNVLSFIEPFFNNPSFLLRREAVWCMSNIAAGTKGQIMTLIDSGIINKIFEKIADPSPEVAREAVWTCSNCIVGSEIEGALRLFKIGILNAFIYCLSNVKDNTPLCICLEGLKELFNKGKQILEFTSQENVFVKKFIEAGGHEALEALQYHANQEVYDKCNSLLENYFEVENKTL